MNRKRKTIDTTWEVWTYDVWGNAEDGYTVNDRNCIYRNYPIRCRIIVCNPRTEREFNCASPSDYQLQSIFSVRCAINTDSGDDIDIYVNRDSDNYPIGELHCISHESLSPICERETS